MGKPRMIAETGAGQHGVATATACALLGLECIVYMGTEDIRRQAPNVERMKLLGAEVAPVEAGARTLKEAVSAAIRDWVANVETTHYVIGSAVGPAPYPALVRDLQRVIGEEARVQALDAEGALPARVIACVGGGSNAIGIFSPFVADAEVALIGVEAAGDGLDTRRHGASLGAGSTGVLHGSLSSVIADEEGQILEAHSVSAGLDYPGVGPEHAHLRDTGRASYVAITDEQALAALRRALAAGGDHPGAGVLARDRLAAGEPGAGRVRRPLPLRPRRQGPGRGRGADERVPGAGLGRQAELMGGNPSNPDLGEPELLAAPTLRSRGEARIAAAFDAARSEGRAALMPYMMAGFPDRETGLAVAAAYVDSGADLIELGVPFSDPLADGPTIHAAATAGARSRGDLRHRARDLPLGRRPGTGGADGLREHGPRARRRRRSSRGWRSPPAPPARSSPTCRWARTRTCARSSPRQGLAMVPLVAPTTSTERRQRICAVARGFVYVVSTVGTTGERGELPAALADLVAATKADREGPVAVGFGIGTPGRPRRSGGSPTG